MLVTLDIKAPKKPGLFQPNFGSNMDKPSHWVKTVNTFLNPMVVFVHI